MSTAQPRMVIQKYNGFGGNFIDSQYLGASYKAGEPHVFENTLAKIYSSQNRFFTGKLLTGMTAAKSVATKEIPTETFRWKLQGAEYKCARVIENMEPGNTAPGYGGTTFRVKLDLDYFAYPDVLMGEDPDFPIQIVDKTYDSTGTIYTLQLQGDNPDNFFPPQFLEIGREFSKVWTSVPSEYNQVFGTQQYPDSFKLEGQVGAFAQKYSVTDKAMRIEGRLGVDFIYTNPTTNKEMKVSRFLPLAEAAMQNTFYQSMEAQLWYGKKQTKIIDETNYWTKTGAGLREILKEGHTEYYNGPLTTNMLKDYLMSIFFSREDEQNRAVVAMTGTLGSVMFHDMLAAEASSFFTLDTHFIADYNAGLRGRHLSYGAQFRHYQGPEGIEVTLIKNPMYDSRQYNKRMHPIYSEFPVDSARMTFLDFGSTGGDNNVSMVKVQDTYRYGYTVGTVGPNGPVKGGQAGALKAGYDVFMEGTAGLWVKDPTRGGELIYDFEY